MTADQNHPAAAPMAQPDPQRYGDGAAPSADYVGLPEQPSEVVAISGSANEELTHAEMGAFDADD